MFEKMHAYGLSYKINFIYFFMNYRKLVFRAQALK